MSLINSEKIIQYATKIAADDHVDFDKYDFEDDMVSEINKIMAKNLSKIGFGGSFQSSDEIYRGPSDDDDEDDDPHWRKVVDKAEKVIQGSWTLILNKMLDNMKKNGVVHPEYADAIIDSITGEDVAYMMKGTNLRDEFYHGSAGEFVEPSDAVLNKFKNKVKAEYNKLKKKKK